LIWLFPISRDPPEGGTPIRLNIRVKGLSGFQFLGIPPKGELNFIQQTNVFGWRFQFLGIPPKGELVLFPVRTSLMECFQFLGIPPKGELPLT